MTTATRRSLTYIHDDTEFYPHQITGVRHLARLTSFLLADEPGLGKSLQALTVFAIDVERGLASRLLVVCPATLKGNWIEEIKKHTSFTAMVLEGTPKQCEQQILDFNAMKMQVLICNYEQVAGHLPGLNALHFDMAVYDEAHSIKNQKSKRTRSCQMLYARRHGLLTGTPIMNNVSDLWSLLYRIAPDQFPSYWTFLNRYAVFGGYQNKQIVGVKNEKELKERLDAYMLRRRKADVLDLPEKQRIVVPVELHPIQLKLYKQAKEEGEIDLPYDPTPMDVEHALTRFQKLKQICGTASTIPGYGDYSYKLDRVEELIEEIAENGGHVVVFTQFRGVLEAMQHRLASLGAPTFVLSGAVPIGERAERVAQWSNYPKPAVLLSMLQVGGVGLNMTKARHMIFIDKDFTPAVNEQAEDRIHRIGADTTQPVQIYEMTCRNTIEARVEEILRTKTRVFGSLVNDTDFKKKLIAALAAEEDD